jgi:hypothetical protein
MSRSKCRRERTNAADHQSQIVQETSMDTIPMAFSTFCLVSAPAPFHSAPTKSRTSTPRQISFHEGEAPPPSAGQMK